jgi:hypothetical protein
MRITRRLRILRHAARTAEVSMTSAHVRFPPAIRHNHRTERRRA